MRWEVYKQRCDQPDVVSRWMIEQTAELLDAGLRERLLAELAEKPIPPPRGHLGDDRADMFVINDLSDVALEISDSVDRAVIAGRRTSATTIHGVGRFGEIWCSYAAYVKRMANV